MAISDMERNEFIMKCLNDGMTLSALQKELISQFDLHMTYMELRMLTSDLQVNWSKQDAATEAAKPKSKDDPKKAAAGATASQESPAEMDADGESAESGMADAAADGQEAPAEAPSAGKTTVEVSKLVRPGTAMSGTVNFGSGAKGEWYLDNMGRLGFEPAEGSSQPTRQDIQEFQMELRKALGY